MWASRRRRNGLQMRRLGNPLFFFFIPKTRICVAIDKNGNEDHERLFAWRQLTLIPFSLYLPVPRQLFLFFVSQVEALPLLCDGGGGGED
jgi:hypothetical protein